MISLTAITNCAGLPKPDTKIKVYETAYFNGEWFCGEYEVSDKKITRARDIKFVHIKDHPLSMCIGVNGFKGADFPAVFDYIDKLQNYYEDKCEGK